MPPQLEQNKSNILRVSMLLWGSAGCGKTHFANTAPGKRVNINFDPDGLASLPPSEDTLKLDYSMEHPSYVNEVKSANPFGLDTLLKEREDIKTIIVDSVTAFTTAAVAYSANHKNAPGSVFENPGIAGYGFRNRFALGLVKSLLITTGKYNRHVIFICHEDVPQTSQDGTIQAITVLLGGSLKEEVPLQISEVWRMQDRTTQRVVQVRSAGITKPMKSRMFDTSDGSEFVTSTNKEPNKVQLAALFQAWQENKYDKLKLPK